MQLALDVVACLDRTYAIGNPELQQLEGVQSATMDRLEAVLTVTRRFGVSNYVRKVVLI